MLSDMLMQKAILYGIKNYVVRCISRFISVLILPVYARQIEISYIT